MASTRSILTSFKRLAREPYGAKFYKVDFHFHTPGSADARGKNRYGFNPYKDIKYPKNDHSWARVKQVRRLQEGVLEEARRLARSMIDRYLEERLAMVAITDHNGIATLWPDPDDPRGKAMDLSAPTWYELISEEADLRNRELGKTAITILPGTEISTSGVHILAVFPPSSPKRKIHFKICDLLTEVGFSVEDFGKNPKVGKASVYQTLELITAKGGIPIIAHIDGSDQSLLKLYGIKSGAMKGVLSNPHLHAIEMVKPSRLSRPQKGLKTESLGDWIARVRHKAGLDPVAYFQGSDAHDLPTIGKRFTYLKMTSPSFSGLHSAIQAPSARIRVGDLHEPSEDGLYVYGADLRSPFLGRRYVHFNRHLNCIVGRKDCGKSLMLRLMRKAVDASADVEGDIKLYMERRDKGTSSLYCYTLSRGSIELHALERDGDDDWTVEPISPEDPEFGSLSPKFYDPDRMEHVISDDAALQRFLVGRFGRPTERRAAKVSALFELPGFLSSESNPLLRLQLTEDGRYAVGLNTRWRSGRPKFTLFSRLSKSRQRFVIITIVLLSARPGPLIIDDPGGHFDNEDIATYLVPLIKHVKTNRQVIFATNNSNLTINADPENYVVLEASRGKLKRMQAGMAIDDQAQREALITIMEGSLKSFRKRGLHYQSVE